MPLEAPAYERRGHLVFCLFFFGMLLGTGENVDSGATVFASDVFLKAKNW